MNTSIRGDVVILKRFRAVYILMNEVYLVTVCYNHDYPFDAQRLTNMARSLLFDACKGVDVTVSELFKLYGQIVVALDELLNETNTFKTPFLPFEIVQKKEKLFFASTAIVDPQQQQDSKASNAAAKRGTLKKGQILDKAAIESALHQQQQQANATNASWEESKKQVQAHTLRIQALQGLTQLQQQQQQERIGTNTFGACFVPPQQQQQQQATTSIPNQQITPATMPTKRSLPSIPQQQQQQQPSSTILDNFSLLHLGGSGNNSNSATPVLIPDHVVSPFLDTTMQQISSLDTQQQQPSDGALLDALLDLPMPTTTTNTNTTTTINEQLPLPPIPLATTPNKTSNTNTNSNTNTSAAFDPSQILTKFKERARVLPLTIVITETIQAMYTNQGTILSNYQLIGQVAVKRANSESVLADAHYPFVLQVRQVENIASHVCNAKFCELERDSNLDNMLRFKCAVPTSALSSSDVPLFKYKLQPQMQPVPLQIVCKYQQDKQLVKLLLLVQVSVPLNSLSLLVEPVTSPHLVTAVQSKPEARWNAAQQKLLWKCENLQPNQEIKLMAQCKLEQVADATATTVGSILVKFASDQHLYAQVEVDGCKQKKTDTTHDVFLGGLEKQLTSGKFEYH